MVPQVSLQSDGIVEKPAAQTIQRDKQSTKHAVEFGRGCCFCGGYVDGDLAVEQKRLEEQARQDYAAANEKILVLLLGTAESGKSTIFKQMKVRMGRGLLLSSSHDCFC